MPSSHPVPGLPTLDMKPRFLGEDLGLPGSVIHMSSVVRAVFTGGGSGGLGEADHSPCVWNMLRLGSAGTFGLPGPTGMPVGHAPGAPGREAELEVGSWLRRSQKEPQTAS